MKEKTKVIFRKFQDQNKDVVALFPEIPCDIDKRYCSSYMHLGQHGSADYHYVISISVPAKEPEYQELKDELEKIGYILDIRKRFTKNEKFYN